MAHLGRGWFNDHNASVAFGNILRNYKPRTTSGTSAFDKVIKTAAFHRWYATPESERGLGPTYYHTAVNNPAFAAYYKDWHAGTKREKSWSLEDGLDATSGKPDHVSETPTSKRKLIETTSTSKRQKLAKRHMAHAASQDAVANAIDVEAITLRPSASSITVGGVSLTRLHLKALLETDKMLCTALVDFGAMAIARPYDVSTIQILNTAATGACKKVDLRAMVTVLLFCSGLHFWLEVVEGDTIYVLDSLPTHRVRGSSVRCSTQGHQDTFTTVIVDVKKQSPS
ncbi:hypothetical protein SDRG_01397 [Saprolegnia diclina VS20]|uniref:Uncharacterized protein n=1 Tax=Saprolegnia diclina (strain VS20) TaxID=1156394 RepID=T0QTD4_SAPDV|nr:hypothetical protein SDRG_01397 [Saprolegnia diclina VS20]EQC41429.1 hypothetical protein SDRG_01397 [Saprolegnia diclina VS20]|eukprot:XP_008605143.1 hypothetical protein SDRG_01397 [Saprolegnia diclina VS20]